MDMAAAAVFFRAGAAAACQLITTFPSLDGHLRAPHVRWKHATSQNVNLSSAEFTFCELFCGQATAVSWSLSTRSWGRRAGLPRYIQSKVKE